MSQKIVIQIQLIEDLKKFLTGLQARLSETIKMYDSSLQTIDGEQFAELLERQRNVYFARTQKEIETLIDMIERSDKPLTDKTLNFLVDLLKTQT